MKPEAHAAYLKGLYFWNKWTPEGSRQAIQCFERAADLDPDAALPHSGLAFVYGQLAAMGQIRPSVGYPRAEAEALRGLELDPNSGEAHTALAMGRLFYRWDFDGAYEHFQKALSLNPGSAIPRHLYSLYLIATGQPRQAIEEMEVAVSLDPLSLAMRDTLGMAYLAARDAAGAEATYAAILEMDPSFRAAIEGMGWARFEAGDLEGATEWFARYARAVADPLKGIAPLGVAYAHSGREAEAREILARTEERARRDPDSVLTLEFAALHAALGDRDRAFEFLEQAYDQRLGACLLLTSFSFWDSIREDPRFAAIQQRVGSGA